IHPGIGGALGAGANLAGVVDRFKRGGSSGRMMTNEEYQLFIDNGNALVYAANNQIVDGMASDYSLKIEPNGLLTVKNLKVINFDFAAAESGTVWVFEAAWYNSGDVVPDQVTTAGDANPQSDGTATTEICAEYSRGDHVHPLNITITIPLCDSSNGSVGTTNYYSRNDHSHPINVQTNASIIPIINGVGANGTSDFYARHDHVHPQQLTYDGNITAINGIFLGCDLNQTRGTQAGQWSILAAPTGELTIVVSVQASQANRGLVISADGNALYFNDSVIAGTGATNGAINGSVNYSAGNPILWGVNSVGTEGGFLQ
ncbi:MAG: hypothetical protein EZS28_016318, partial [Streblomastix strix]